MIRNKKSFDKCNVIYLICWNWICHANQMKDPIYCVFIYWLISTPITDGSTNVYSKKIQMFYTAQFLRNIFILVNYQINVGTKWIKFIGCITIVFRLINTTSCEVKKSKLHIFWINVNENLIFEIVFQIKFIIKKGITWVFECKQVFSQFSGGLRWLTEFKMYAV